MASGLWLVALPSMELVLSGVCAFEALLGWTSVAALPSRCSDG